MNRRFGKQLLYGIFYIVFLGGIIWGSVIYFIAARTASSCSDEKQNQGEIGLDCGGPCVACEIKSLKPLSIGPAALFGNDRVFSVAAPVRNPNANFGAGTFGYEINFYDESDRALQAVRNKGFIYPGETKNIIEAGIFITTGVPRRAEIKLSNVEDIEWEDAKAFSAPAYEIKEAAVSLEDERVTVGGYFTNVNNFKLSRVILSVFLVDASGENIGVSKTELTEVEPFQVENFKIFIPIKQSFKNSIDGEAVGKSLAAEIIR